MRTCPIDTQAGGRPRTRASLLVDPSQSRHHSRRSGFALLLVLMVIAMISLAAYTMTDRLVIENETARLSGQQLQARSAVDSGVSHVLYLLETPAATRLEYGGVYQNPTLFQGQLVVDHELPRQRVRFGVVAPMLDQQGYAGGWRWGLEDESAKLNVNTLQLEDASGASGGAESGNPDAAAGATNANATAGGMSQGGGGNLAGGNGGGGSTGGASGTGNNTNTNTNTGNNRGTQNTSGGNTGASNGNTNGNTSGGAGGTGNAADGSDQSGAEQNSDEPIVVDASGRTVLMMLPGMTVEVADAILDWIDEDDIPREYGAEIDDYSQLSPPYAPRNGPIDNIEELLLVRGVTPDLLFGRDVNRNGLLDVAEQNLPLGFGVDDGTSAMDLGWASMLTVFSQERNVTWDGQPRIAVNGEDLQLVYDELSAVMDPAWATFIVAYRLYGPFQGTSQNTIGASADVELDLTATGGTQIASLLDLIGTKVQLPGQNGAMGPVMESPFTPYLGSMMAYLPVLMDQCTTQTEKVLPGRININQASRAVLMTVPGFTEEMVDAVIAQRDPAGAESSASQAHETWILGAGIVTLAEMKAIQPFITAGGDVYRAQIVGYFDQGEIASRVEAVFDASAVVPRLLSWRDISHLGRGYARETLGVSGMSSNVGP